MNYEIETTLIFDKWLTKIKDKKIRYRLDARFDRILCGNFGDYKQISPNLFELRFFFTSGLRIYYTVHNNKVVLLLKGGDKSTQANDIKQASALLNALEE